MSRQCRHMTPSSVVLFTSLLLLQGCKEIECGAYRSLVDDSGPRTELTQWADQAVFSRQFLESDFQLGGMSGPGPGPGNLKPELALTLLPDYLKGYNVRLIGPDRKRPSMVLIGESNYQGILISRGAFDSELAKTRIKQDELELSIDRVGLICLMPFE